MLSGGVFQNRLLLTWSAERLEALGHTVLVPERLPANDGGIAYGAGGGRGGADGLTGGEDRTKSA